MLQVLAEDAGFSFLSDLLKQAPDMARYIVGAGILAVLYRYIGGPELEKHRAYRDRRIDGERAVASSQANAAISLRATAEITERMQQSQGDQIKELDRVLQSSRDHATELMQATRRAARAQNGS